MCMPTPLGEEERGGIAILDMEEVVVVDTGDFTMALVTVAMVDPTIATLPFWEDWITSWRKNLKIEELLKGDEFILYNIDV